MTTVRTIWYEAHLLSDRVGRRAREACERLGPGVHERILADGDRLAQSAALVAQAFYKHAAPVWQALGADEFGRWFNLGYTLLTAEPTQRDAALAFFTVPPKVVAAVGTARLAAWCAVGRRVCALSRKLGATFFETTGALLNRTDDARLDEWVRQGVRLHGLAGWRGEFMAQAYFAAAPAVLPSLGRDDFAPWADLGAALQRVVRESEFFARLPRGLATLEPNERRAVLATALAVARVNAAAGAALYREVPAVVARVHGGTRTALLDTFALAGPVAATAVGDVAPVVGALVRDIPAPHRRAAIELLRRVAQRFPQGAVALLRSLPKAYEDTRHAGVETWIRRGIEIAAGNADAGLAYFALESRTSVQVLLASSTAATLADVQGLLRKYVHMLSGMGTSIRPSDPFSLRPPLEEFPGEHEIALPLKVDVFPTHEDNVRLYRLVAAHLAGRREFGTYVPLSDDAGDLVAHLRAPEQPVLLEDLFLLADGFRVGAALARVYPGLAREQQETTALLLDRYAADPPPGPGKTLDLVLAALFAGRNPARLPVWLRPLVTVVAPLLAPLAHHLATMRDALQIAHLLVDSLGEPSETRQQQMAGHMYDALGAEALFDPYADDAPPMPYEGSATTDTPPPAPDVTEPPEVQLELDEEPATEGVNAPLSAEELQRLIESGVDLRIKQGYADDLEGLGLYITDLLGKLPADQLDELRKLLQDEDAKKDRPPPRRWLDRRSAGTTFVYDEWDYHIADYRRHWCRLRELTVDGDSGEFFTHTLDAYAALIPDVRRQFQRIRPETYRLIRGLEHGEDFDLNAVVNARVDRRARQAPSPKLYVARAREERDVATLFLIDLSASTDEPLEKPAAPRGPDTALDVLAARGPATVSKSRRIIDLTKEALVIMAQALAEIGDAYAIYGFSGHGRDNVEFYLVKSFNESLSSAVKGRIGTLEPKRSTGMGTALRHATEKLASVHSRSRHIILLSDGFPQDFDYGQDRRSNVYGLRDTTAALREADAAGITPFCITVDKAGHDYLREMCDGSRYMVIDDVFALPRELPNIYQRVVGS